MSRLSNPPIRCPIVENHISVPKLIYGKLLRRLALLSLLVALGAGAAEPVTVAVLAPRGEARALEQWQPTMRRLEEALPGYRFRVRPLDLEGLAAAVAAGEVDFVLTHPAQFVLLGAPHRLSWLATLRSSRTGSTRDVLGSALLVRADSPYRKPADLRGRPVAAVHPRAFGGYLLLLPRLAEVGLDPAADFELRFLGFPNDALLYQLRDGVVDAAVVPACLLETMDAEGLLDRRAFRLLLPAPAVNGCLSSTPGYPDWSFGALPHVPEPLATAVARALLTDGHWGAPIPAAQVDDLLRGLELHPLQRPLSRQLADLLWRYRGYSLLALALLLTGLLHHLWLQRRDVRRSRELSLAHQHLRERERELAASQRLSLLGELAAGLAHDLNQPLAAIRHYAEGCSTRLAREAPDHPLLPVLARIDEEAARGAAVVERARGWLRREPRPASPLPLAELIDELRPLLEPQLKGQDVELHQRIAPGLRVMADRTALEQVLSNLIGNSLQAYAAAGRGGPIEIEARAEAERVWIHVRDQAGGFSPERLREPFAPFRSSRPDGLGLGLMICQRLLREQGGTLELANRAGGAEVTLSLPAERR